MNRPIKQVMAEQWEDLLDSEGVQNSNAMAIPPCELIATWVVEGYLMLKTESCKKAWKKDLNGLSHQIIIHFSN